MSCWDICNSIFIKSIDACVYSIRFSGLRFFIEPSDLSLLINGNDAKVFWVFLG